MTKAEIIQEITARTGIDKKDALNVIGAFMETSRETWVTGKKFSSVDAAVSLSSGVRKRRYATFQGIRPSLFRLMKFQYSGRPRNL